MHFVSQTGEAVTRISRHSKCGPKRFKRLRHVGNLRKMHSPLKILTCGIES